MGESDKDLPIKIIRQPRLPQEPKLPIRVLSQRPLEQTQQVEEVTASSNFRQFIDAMAGYFGSLFGATKERTLDIRVLRVLQHVPQETIEIGVQQIKKNQLPISVLRAYLTTKRSLDKNAWGEINPEAKRSAFAAPEDSAFDLPIRVMSQDTIPVEERAPIINYDQEWTRRQVQALAETFGREKLDTPVHLSQHHLQKYRFNGLPYQGRSVSSCLAASVYNALDALGLRGTTSEDDLIRDGHFLSNGDMDATSAFGMLSKRNILSYPTDSLVEIARVLEQHGVIIVMSNWHAKLISGMSSDGLGNVRFRVNNPLEPEQITWTARQLAENIATGINDTRARSGLALPFDFSCIAIQPNLNIRVIGRTQLWQSATSLRSSQ